MSPRKKISEPTRISLPLFFRLLIYVFILLTVILHFKVSGQLFLPFLCYSLATFALLTLLLFKERFNFEPFFKLAIVVQLIFEVLVETGIMAASGRAESPFAILFLLTIVSASLFYNLAGALLVATLSSLGYASTIIWGNLFAFQNLLSVNWIKNIYQLNDTDFYRIFLYLCSFYLIAFLSGYLSDRLKIKGQELSLISLELDRMKMETDDILQHMHSGLITIDATGRVIYYNKTAEEVPGLFGQRTQRQEFSRGLDQENAGAVRKAGPGFRLGANRFEKRALHKESIRPESSSGDKHLYSPGQKRQKKRGDRRFSGLDRSQENRRKTESSGSFSCNR